VKVQSFVRLASTLLFVAWTLSCPHLIAHGNTLSFALALIPDGLLSPLQPPDPSLHPDLIITDPEQALRMNAETIAKLEGISPETAYARLKWQPVIGELNGLLQGQSDIAFGGMWLAQDNEAVLHIAVKNLPGERETADLEKVKALVAQKLSGMAGVYRMEYHTVAFSYAELFEAQAALRLIIENAKLNVISGVITDKNAVEVIGSASDIATLEALAKDIETPAYDEAAHARIVKFTSTGLFSPVVRLMSANVSGWPMGYWLVAAAVCLAIGFVIALQVERRQRRRIPG
jgi:hypothetical protein